MPMQTNTSAVESLVSWREGLDEELASLRDQLASIEDAIALKESQIGHITELLRSEGIEPSAEPSKAKPASLADLAYQALKTLGTPCYYRDFAEHLESTGVVIAGQNPTSNLIAHMSRDDRFVRVARGTYALAEWEDAGKEKGGFADAE